MTELPRTCGDCALCCKLGEIPDFKPFNQWCRFCSTHAHCDIYDSRPAPCREFFCHYLKSDLNEDWFPKNCGMVISTYSGPNRLTVSVDPETPETWRQQPYLAQIIHWSNQGAVTVMVGERAFAVYPDAIEDLGEITDGYIIEINEIVTPHGTSYRSQRVPKPAP